MTGILGDPMSDWIRIGALTEFVRGRARVVEIDGAAVAVFRSREGFVAVGDTCPHMGASLAGGRLVDGTVECPWHHWRYDPETGVSDHRDWARVPVYEVRVEGGDVLLRPSVGAEGPDRTDDEVEDEPWELWDAERFMKRNDAPGGDDV